MRKIILLVSLLFLLISSIYDSYSRDSYLYYMHTIPRGQIFMNDKAKEKVTSINKQIYSKTLTIQIQYEEGQYRVNNFLFLANNKYILSTDGKNFLSFISGAGEIQSHGDSFYQIKDKHSIFCNQQLITDIKYVDYVLYLYGEFLYCNDSQHVIKIGKNSNETISLRVSLLDKESTQKYNRVLIYFPHKNENNYFGLGEQFSYLNLGHNRPFSLWTRYKGIARSEQPETAFMNLLHRASGTYHSSYAPAPIWFSTSYNNFIGYINYNFSYSVWMNNCLLSWGYISFSIVLGHTPKHLLKGVYKVNGRTLPIPYWLNYGAVLGLQGGTYAVMHKYNVLKNAGTKISALWLQDWVSKRKSYQYSRLWWNWELDEQHYPNWTSFQSYLKKDGVDILIYINPMLTYVYGKKPNYKQNLYKYAKYNHYFVELNKGYNYYTSAFSDWKASMIDFYNSKAVYYYKEMFRNAIRSTKARGMMVDFGYAYPVNVTYPDTAAHNKYPVIYQKVVKYILNEFKDLNLYTFSRSGYLYSPKYMTSLWAGDQAMNFKKHSGLPSCLTAMLSSSLVGYTNTHCDIGGYTYYELPFIKTSVRTNILMTRWMQLGAFSPVFRTHEGNMPEKSLQVYSNEEIAKYFAFYSQIYHVFSKYRLEKSHYSHYEYLPLVRPFFLEHPDLKESYKIYDQFYLGPDILVCPYLSEKQERKVYLPQGHWINIWNGEGITGCNCYKNYGYVFPPVFIRKDSKFVSQIVSDVQKTIYKFKNVLKMNTNTYNEKKDEYI